MIRLIMLINCAMFAWLGLSEYAEGQLFLQVLCAFIFAFTSLWVVIASQPRFESNGAFILIPTLVLDKETIILAWLAWNVGLEEKQ